MKEKPILFSAPMVCALLGGSKTQHRTLVKLPHQNPLGVWEPFLWGGPNGGKTREGLTVPERMTISHSRTGEIIGYPYGQPGDRLWVRETWRTDASLDDKAPRTFNGWPVQYSADGEVLRHGAFYGNTKGKKRPSLFMPRWASRLLLEVVSVRVERLQAISEADALAEGVNPSAAESFARVAGVTRPAGLAYRDLWEKINGAGSWDANPWVWCVEFRRVTGSND